MSNLKLVFGAFFLSLAFSANASLIGDTVTFNTYFPNDGALTSSQDFLVTNSVECAGCASAGFVLADQTLDIGADFIEFQSGFTTGFSGPDAIFEFTGLDWVGGLGELVGFNLTTNFANVADSAVAFTGNSIEIDIGNSGQGTFWRLDLRVAYDVPEPGTLALLGLGLAGLGFFRRRQHLEA
ncbi:PEP-CTERM sorting domain-containing protein [Marinobacter sp. CHS3-4]|uniref:PEP-CTERM sorting domain-containing protein n=1 Tax=Marinobacter sp. CHS3-4 TaxID=3045174 RepID=UPI0024B4F7B6|nr:PEP-CTERM sorting domain-containing protein [Marinobacter sp. CHS3-4]MDI9244651.1 PEP-CTERM sorting domain-containing protein [Marinobacter sp. CHS3-4]